MTSMAFHGGRLEGTVSPPPSKSHTHRAFFLASMARGRSVVSNALMSADTRATLAACKAMGADVEGDGDVKTITGGDLHAPGFVDAENSGTTMRIFAGICSMFDGESTITGDDSLRKRPMGPLLSALEQTGTVCESDNGLPPVTVRGPNRGGRVSIDGGVSSQFITSLLMVSPMLERDSEITVEGDMVSAPYLDVTLHMMHLFGADRLFYEGECSSVTVPAVDGQYGVLANHSNVITAIVPGELTFVAPGQEKVIVAVAGGIMKVEDNDVLILVDSVLRPEEIDAERAEREAAAAREALLQKRSRQEYRSVQAQLARAVTKLKVRRKGTGR